MRDFPTADVMSTLTGRLMGQISGVYEVLNWMTGESVYTHQLPRISREAQPVILAAHPELAPTIAEAESVTRDNYQAVLSDWVSRFGETISVPKFSAAEHEAIDPLSELAEIVHPDKIITVQL